MADLALALRRKGYSGPLWGMGGQKSLEAGVLCLWPSSNLQIMGFIEPLKALPRLWNLAEKMASCVISKKPKAVVVVDSPDFHIPLVRKIRKKGYRGKIIFLSPPTVWAWRKGRVSYLRDYFDLCLPLFAFENDCLKKAGVKSLWIGHPMTDRFKEPPKLPDDLSVAILPGSRESELKRLLPVLIPLGKKLKKEAFKPVFSVAEGLKPPVKKALIRSLRGFDIFQGDGADLVGRSHMAVGASGTATVEAMMLGRFMAVVYRTSWPEALMYRVFVGLPHVAMTNIIAGKEVYPEFLQEKCDSLGIYRALQKYRSDYVYKEKVEEALLQCRNAMGQRGVSDFWAEGVLGP